MGKKLRNFGVAVLSIAAFMTLINVVPPAKSVEGVNPFIRKENESSIKTTSEFKLGDYYEK